MFGILLHNLDNVAGPGVLRLHIKVKHDLLSTTGSGQLSTIDWPDMDDRHIYLFS